MNACFYGKKIAICLLFSAVIVVLPKTMAKPLAVVEAATEKELNDLPSPKATLRLPKHLTLQEAIVLALRNNPTVRSSRFQRINDKYALELANYAFQPQFNLSGSATVTEGEETSYTVSPGLTLNTKMGTQLTINNTTDLQGNQQEQLSVTQPLLRGFGSVNKIPWLNAQDGEQIARLSFKNSIMSVITQVIQQYRQVVQDYNGLTIQQKALDREIETERQSRLRVKAGKVAPSELLQEQVTLANNHLETLKQENQAQQDYQILLDTLGLVSTAQLTLDKNINFKEYVLPSEAEATRIALSSNPDYVSQKIQLNATRRAVQSAKNDMWWQLDFSASMSLSTTSGTIPVIGGIGSLSTTENPSATLNLSIPLRNIDRKAALVSAKVSLTQAEDALEQAKRTLIRQVLNSLTDLKNQREQLRIAEQGVQLQRKNFEVEQIKQKYGKTTALSVSIIQDQLLNQEISYISSQIGYLNSVTAFENLLGQTLKTWGVELRY